jgi:hypothetical protein
VSRYIRYEGDQRKKERREEKQMGSHHAEEGLTVV